MTRPQPDDPALDALRAAAGARFSDDRERLRRYEIPERGEPGSASGLLLPDREDEVGALLITASAHRVPLVIAAGRTGLVEAQRPEGEVVLSLERLTRPIDFTLADGRRFTFEAEAAPDARTDALAAWWRGLGSPSPVDATLRVEAGIAVDAVNALLAPLGAMWPMEMGSSSAASVGGCIANASAGANAVCYGTAAHLAREVWGYSAAGEPLHDAAPVWTRAAADALAINSADPTPHQHATAPQQWGLIGTQGVLGVITRAALRVYGIPAQREAALIPVQTMPEAMRVLAAARTVFGEDVEEFEFMSAGAIELVRALRGEAFRWPLPPQPAPFTLLLQVKSPTGDDDLAGRLYEFLAETLALPEDRIGYAPLKPLKEIRHSITEASGARMRARGGGRLSFDTATPVAVFGDYLAALERELREARTDVELIAFGHAGVGGAHLHLIGSREKPVAAHAGALVDIVFDVTARFGGTFSAEHGVGPKWGDEFRRRAPAVTQAALAAAKRERDPRGILNPRSFGLDRIA